MRRGIRIAAWIAVFAACAGVGALIASRTDPFPPGVEDPGSRQPLSRPTSVPSPAETGYVATVSAATRHELYVGGSCATDWRIRLRFVLDDAAAVMGDGVAQLRGKLRCDFATAQAQARRIPLIVRGHLRGGLIELRVRATVMLPLGSNDYGGLVKTLGRFPDVQLRGGGKASVRISDGDQGVYVATYQVRVAEGSG